MRIKRGISLLLIFLIIGTSLVSCDEKKSSLTESSEETKYYSITIDGDKLYYSEDNEDVKSINKLVTDFLDVAVKVDYKNEEYLKELDFYTDAVREEYDGYGYRDNTKEFVNKYELIIEVNGHDDPTIEFYKTNEAEFAKVNCEYINTIIGATDDYFTDNGIEDMKLGEQRERGMELTLTKEDNKWKVVDYFVYAIKE